MSRHWDLGGHTPSWILASLPLLAGACRPPAAAPRPAKSSATPGSRTRPRAPSKDEPLHVEVALDAGKRRLDVRMCFPGPPPRHLRARHGRTLAALTGTHPQLPQTPRPPALALPRVLPEGCVAYGLDVDRLGGRAVASPHAEGTAEDTFLLRTSDWLLRPDPLPKGASPRVSFHLAPGQAVSTPWGDGPAAPTIFRWLSYVAIGAVDVRRLEIEGGVVEVALLGGPYRDDGRPVVTLVRDVSTALAEVHGGLPRAHIQVTVFPVRGSGSVYFGKVVRGGGPGVHLLINPESAYSDLASSWTAFHELQHLGLPFVSDPWMSEGFASYYAELERTRRGHRSEAEGWRRLEAAFRRGRRRGRGLTLQATSDHMHGLFAYQRVYWSGAALAFLMDVELRRTTGGRLGLDDAMRALAPRLDATRQIPAAVILARWDEWIGGSLFSDIAAAHLGARAFPDVSEAYRWLGVRFDGDAVTFDEAAPGAAARRAIMAPRAAPPSMARASESIGNPGGRPPAAEGQAQATRVTGEPSPRARRIAL